MSVRGCSKIFQPDFRWRSTIRLQNVTSNYFINKLQFFDEKWTLFTNTAWGGVHINMSTSTSTGSGFRLWPVEASVVWVERSRSLVQAHNSTHAIKTTTFHYKVTIFTNGTSPMMNNFTMTSVLFFLFTVFINYINAMLFTNSLFSRSWIKTQLAQKLLVWVKFTGNLYSYVCERLPARHWNTRKLVFAGTRIREPVHCWTRTAWYS